MGDRITDTKKMLCSHHYADRNIKKNPDGLFSLIFDEGELMIRKNHWFFHIIGINK